MSATFNQDKVNLRELANLVKPHNDTILQDWYIGDGTTVTFKVSEGATPFQVFNAGLLVKEGAGDEYTFTNGHINFAVAPALNNDIAIFSKVLT